MKRFNMVFRVAACVAVAALAVYAGRRLRTHFGVRSSVAEWSAKIAKAKPAVAEAADRAGGRMFILVFKNERLVELRALGWDKPLLYKMTGFSGRLGPKLREGDRQIPEGVYGIEYLNPNSMFHLSLKVSYPNDFDRQRAAEDGRSNLGGDIMIHGSSATVGCIPVGDDAIEDIFCLAAAVGKENVTVVVAPYDMRKGRIADLEKSPLPWYGALCDDISRALKKFSNPDVEYFE